MSKTPSELVIDARWVLPITPANVVLEHASIAIAGGRIQAVGARQDIHARFVAAEVVKLPDHAVLPGLVNAHGHAAMSLLRGVAEDAPVEAWLNDHIWPLEHRLVDEGFVRDGTRLALAEMIHCGITCFSDMYFFPEVVAEAARTAGLRCQVAFPVIPFANAWSSGVDEALHKGMALHDQFREHPLVRVAFGPHAAYSVGRADLERVLMYAEELDAAIQIHLHESAAEVADARALGLDDQIGSLEPGKMADLAAVDLGAARFQPVHDPIATLVHTGSGSAISHVWVAGKSLLADRTLTTLDEAGIVRAASAWQRRVGG
jgi:5-methylthioadenosine/S-adenosylhomocysteine deaminase